jgi:pantothenate kinase-related protein Tda10
MLAKVTSQIIAYAFFVNNFIPLCFRIQTVSTCVSLNDDVVMDIINTKSRLRFLKSHLDAINQEDSPTSKANECK